MVPPMQLSCFQMPHETSLPRRRNVGSLLEYWLGEACHDGEHGSTFQAYHDRRLPRLLDEELR
jgi:hypothetical protein